MANISVPANQTVLNTPLFQQSFKNDPKFGDALHRAEASDPAVYLTRLLNLSLNAFGEDCVIYGMKVKFNSGLNSTLAEFKINPGIFIKDSTLLELINESTISCVVNSDYDHLIISIHYDFSENIEENPFEIHLSLWNKTTEKIDSLAGKLILGVFKYEIDGMLNLSRIEDVTLDDNSSLPMANITQRNTLGNIIGTSIVKPNPKPVREMYRKLLESRDLHPNDVLFQDQTGINGLDYQPPLYYFLGLPLFDKIVPENTLFVELGLFGEY